MIIMIIMPTFGISVLFCEIFVTKSQVDIVKLYKLARHIRHVV